MTPPHTPADAVLLVNLGTPDEPTPAAVRRYLREFLWDPRIVDLPRPFWWLILHGIILNTRPRRAAAAYRKIWWPEGSPLLEITRRQARALAERLEAREKGPLPVAFGMRYGRPSIRTGLESLVHRGARKVLVLPLYPQFATATTASTWDAVDQAVAAMAHPPGIDRVEHFFDHPGYIEALAASVRDFRSEQGTSDHLLMSFHGMPQSVIDAGDPYADECGATAAALARHLDLPDGAWSLSFQSRFGRAEWIRPYTTERLRELAAQGLRSVDVICPGFAADCLETLEEIAMQNRGVFLAAGGERYLYIPALNDQPLFIDALADIVERTLAGTGAESSPA